MPDPVTPKKGAALFSLEGKVAIVTGASRGIGAAIAHGLAEAGAFTAGLGRSAAPAEPLSAGAEYHSCDVTDGPRFAAICDDLVKRKGRLDVLVNAAGISLPLKAGDDPEEIFSKTLEVNLVAVSRCCRLAAAAMKKSGGGSIINVTSINSALGFPGNPGYVASKGGLRLLTKALAHDYGTDWIRVNSLAPGYIHTAMTEGSYRDPVRNAERMQRMMLKRWGQPADLAGAAIFLASDASSYVTGTDLFVDGGWTAKGI